MGNAESVLPPKIEQEILQFMREGKNGCYELHIHQGELRKVQMVTSRPLE